MPLKSAKKVANKRKQNGKRVIKAQVSKAKQKFEVESTPKEQVSELDKEILTIKISELENKLCRRKHLCSYMEEEISIYQAFYSKKQLLKSESMKLLNGAFEDFVTEIFLLNQELVAMRHKHSSMSGRQTFCSFYREKVRALYALEAKLEENLLKSEKCVFDIPELGKRFFELEEKVTKERERFEKEKGEIASEFELSLNRIESELNVKIETAIKDETLKLDLLPPPYRAMFLHGWLSGVWLHSTLEFCDRLSCRNSEMEREWKDLALASNRNRKVVRSLVSAYEGLLPRRLSEMAGSEEVRLLSEREEPADRSGTNEQCAYLKMKKLQQKNKIESMKSEITDLETAIQSLKVVGETCFEKSFLVQIIHKARNIVKQEL